MEKLVIKNSKDIDRHELVQFLKTRSEKDKNLIPITEKCQRYVDSLLDSMVQHNVLAYVNGELSGWLGLIEVNPALMILFEWHPLVISFELNNKLAQNLLKEAFMFVKNKGISNIRVFVDVKEENKKEFYKLQELYESVKMKKTHIHNCMEHTLSEKDIKDVRVPLNMVVTSLEDQNKEELLECYHKVFKDSLDDFINSLDEEERSYWDFFNLGTDSVASYVLKSDGEILGFAGVRDYKDFVEFGPIGIVPEYRGKGLSKILMNSCYSNLLDLNKRNGYIEVSESNLAAFNLYSEFGFKIVSKKHGFIIRLKEGLPTPESCS